MAIRGFHQVLETEAPSVKSGNEINEYEHSYNLYFFNENEYIF